MLGLSANLNYYLFNGNVDLRKGIFRLCESIREEMSLDPSDASNVYMFMSRNLEHFMGSVSTDGYTVYRMFDRRSLKGASYRMLDTLQEAVGRCLAIRQNCDGYNRPYR